MWKLVGKLHKRNDFAGDPIESLHRAITRLCPEARSVSDVAITPNTNAHLKQKLEQHYKKSLQGSRRLEYTVSMAMLCHSPADYPEGEDFHVYVRDPS